MNYYISAIQSNLRWIEPALRETKPLYVLETFFNGSKECKSKKKLAKNEFMLDSGAFTFMNSKQDITKAEIEDYLMQYINFINENDIDNFMEMDLDVIFGYEQIKDWRKEIEKLTNKQPIPVWHKSRGIEDYKKTLKEYEYVAIGGFAIKELKKKEFSTVRKMVTYAKHRGNKVHGLGYSRQDTPTWDFHSVDSASWKVQASRFQTTIKFEKGIVVPTVKKNDKYKLNEKALVQQNFQEIMKYQYFLKNLK